MTPSLLAAQALDLDELSCFNQYENEQCAGDVPPRGLEILNHRKYSISMNDRKHGRIGIAKRVHILRVFGPGDYGISLCGWAGRTVLTPEPVTCSECKARENAR
jgi:hypothetical protein